MTDVQVERADIGTVSRNLTLFQAEVKEWAYRNFGAPGEGRSDALERLYAYIESDEDADDFEKRYQHILGLAQVVRDAPPDAPAYRPLLGIVEELGELAHAHLKGEQGIRLTPEQVLEKKKDAVGDLFVYAADYCNRNGLTLPECIERAWGEVRDRDWRKNKMDGVSG